VSEQNAFLELINSKLGHYIVASSVDKGDLALRINRESVLDFFNLLKLDSQLQFNLFLSVTVVDWMDAGEERFEVVYHLLSTQSKTRLRVKVWVPEQDCKIASVSKVWAGAGFMEREAWDMYGVVFEGHDDLRRILMYDEFVGYPLRKDYPVQAKQPRIQLRAPEVSNTALNMKRDNLVKITKKSHLEENSRKVA